MRESPGLAGRDDEGVGGSDLVQTAIVERRRAIEDEAEDQLPAVAAERQGFAVSRTKRADFGEAAGRDVDFGLLRLTAVGRSPGSLGGDMAEEALAPENAARIVAVGELEPMVGECGM